MPKPRKYESAGSTPTDEGSIRVGTGGGSGGGGTQNCPPPSPMKDQKKKPTPRGVAKSSKGA
jgi:hypothetical protein